MCSTCNEIKITSLVAMKFDAAAGDRLIFFIYWPYNTYTGVEIN